MQLTFAQVTVANTSRAARWHPGFPFDNNWTGADWSNAMCGEAGELANVVKKLRRLETGAVPGPSDPGVEELRQMLADEIGDVFAYLDLLATYYGIHLPTAIASKFNRISERQDFPERLPLPSAAADLARATYGCNDPEECFARGLHSDVLNG